MSSPECLAADARSATSYERALGGWKAALLHTDPPYCLLTRRRKGGDLRDPRDRKIDRDPVVRFESVREYREFTEAWLPHALHGLREDAVAIIWTNLLGKDPIVAVAKAHGFRALNGEFIWGKRTTEKNQNEYLLRVYEVALVLTRTPLPEPRLDEPPRVWSAVTGYEEGEAETTGDHPHHKPFGAVDALIRQYSKPGEVVLDPFAGSGSIPAAALKLGRRVACMELKPDWAARVTERLQAIGPVG
jgi:site-specific DNA-methyltransferase (adenine-specific)